MINYEDIRIKKTIRNIHKSFIELFKGKDYEKIMKDDSHIDTRKWKPLIYKFREYTSTGDRLGLNFNFQEV